MESHVPSVRMLKHRGFTMTELSIVLGIMGLVLGAIWTASATVYERYRVNKAVYQTTAILQKMRTLYAEQNTFDSGPLTASMLAANIFSPDMISNGIPRNPWGTTSPVADVANAGIGVGAMPGVGWGFGGPAFPRGDHLQIVFWGVPRSVSIQLISRFTGQNAGDVDFAYCDGPVAGTVTFPNPRNATPADLIACGNGPNLVNIVLYFRK